MRSVLLSGALCLFAASSAAQEIGKVKFLAGQVTVTRGAATSSASAGTSLSANDIVHTSADAPSGARIVLLDASELTLGPGTELRVVLHNPETQQTTIEMLHGHLRARVTPVTKPGGKFQVRTPTAVAVALGTVVEVSTNPVLNTDKAELSQTVSQEQINNLPATGRDFREVLRLAPGAEGSMNPSGGNDNGLRQAMLAANDSVLGRENYSSSLNGNLDLSTVAASSEGLISLTNLSNGAVQDVRPDALGNFRFDRLAPANYSFRAQGFGANYAMQSRVTIPAGINVSLGTLRPASAGQPANAASSLAPSYSYSPDLGERWLQNQIVGLRFDMRSISATASGSTPSENRSAVSTAGFGATNFFNPETQSYNALGPFASPTQTLTTGSRQLRFDFTERMGSTSALYSRTPPDFISGPVNFPGFGEGSNFGSGRAARTNSFFAPEMSTAPNTSAQSFGLTAFPAPPVNRQPLGFERTFLDGPSNSSSRRGFQIGVNYAYDPDLGSGASFTYTASPQLTSSQDYVVDFGRVTSGRSLPFRFEPSTGARRRIFEPPSWVAAPPPITDPRISYYAWGIFGWWPVGPNGHPYSEEEIETLHIGDSSGSNLLATGGIPGGAALPNYSNLFNQDVRIVPHLEFAPANERPSRTVLRGSYGRYSSGIPINDLILSPRVQLNTNWVISQPYETNSDGGEVARALSSPGLTWQLPRDTRQQASSDGEGNRILPSDRLAQTYLEPPKRSKHSSYVLTENPYRSLRSRYDANTLEVPRYALRAIVGGIASNSWDSWCRSSRYTHNDKYDYKQIRAVDYVLPRQYFGSLYGYSQPLAPAYPRRLEEIASGVTQRGAGFGLWDYPDVSVTIIMALDHWVAVGSSVPGTRTQYGQSGQMIIVRAGQAAQPPVAVFHPNGTVGILQQASLKDIPEPQNLLRAVPDFNANGTCVATYVLNGVVLFGGSPTAVTYKMLGTGSSTGQVIRVIVTNNTNCAVYFMVGFGAVLQPHSLEHKIGAAISLLLGSNLNVNNIKSYQIMINFGGTTIAIIVVPAPSPSQHPADMGGHVAAGSPADADSEAEQLPPNAVEGFLRSYCLELHKLAPHPDTRYEFADAKLQEDLGPNASFLQRIFELVQSGALKIPQGHSLDSLIQWTLWASRENMDEAKFMESYMTLVHHNYDAQKRKWDKDAQHQMEESGKTLWQAVKVGLVAN